MTDGVARVWAFGFAEADELGEVLLGQPPSGERRTVLLWVERLSGEAFVEVSLKLSDILKDVGNGTSFCLVVGWQTTADLEGALYDGAMEGLVRSAAKEVARLKGILLGVRGELIEARVFTGTLGRGMVALSGSVIGLEAG